MPRKNGEKKASPWALIWREENYYLAAYDSAEGIMKHYRVDKIGQVKVLKAAREGMEQFARVDLAEYTNQTFGMFGGEEQTVTLQFPNRLIGVVIDRFGREVDIRPMTDRVFRIRARVAVSGQFFGCRQGAVCPMAWGYCCHHEADGRNFRGQERLVKKLLMLICLNPQSQEKDI